MEVCSIDPSQYFTSKKRPFNEFELLMIPSHLVVTFCLLLSTARAIKITLLSTHFYHYSLPTVVTSLRNQPPPAYPFSRYISPLPSTTLTLLLLPPLLSKKHDPSLPLTPNISSVNSPISSTIFRYPSLSTFPVRNTQINSLTKIKCQHSFPFIAAR